MQADTQKATTKVAPKNVPAAKAETAVTIHQDFADGGWDTETVDTKDILIPKILLMHGSSDLVKKGVRNVGEIIKSTSEEVVAKRNETLDVLVFEKWKEWRIMKKPAGKERYEYVRTEAWAPENDELPWEYQENGEDYRRDKTMNFYGLIAKEAEAGTGFPVKLSFVRTSFRSGLKIADAYSRALMNKQPPTSQIFKIGSEVREGVDDSYLAFTAVVGEKSSEAMQKAALGWRKIVQQAKKTNAVVDHEVDDEPVVKKASSTTEF